MNSVPVLLVLVLIKKIASNPDEVEAEFPPECGGVLTFHSGKSALVAWLDYLQGNPQEGENYFFRFLEQASRITSETAV